MPNIIFTLGASTFTFSKGRSFPVDDPAAVNVAVDYSEGGQLYAYDKGIAERFHNLVFERLPLTDFTAFGNWLTNVAIGPKNPFTYTDEASVSHTVRLLDTRQPLREVSAGLYSGTIRLREEIQ
ncbi:MAG: hypothetical protein AB1568_04780 [Thermodesulfobacteriota bacterium]